MTSLDYRREAARYLLDWACQGVLGVSETHKVYVQVTEGRDGPTPTLRARYSSCADLAHWLLFRLGCRETWVNRKEHLGWAVGANLNRLCPRPIGPCPSAKPRLGVPEEGDIVVVNNRFGGHVLCVTGLESRPEGDLMHAAEYGQPGGQLRAHTLTEQFTKSVISHVSLADVPWSAEPDVSVLGQWLTGEELDALEALR